MAQLGNRATKVYEVLLERPDLLDLSVTKVRRVRPVRLGRQAHPAYRVQLDILDRQESKDRSDLRGQRVHQEARAWLAQSDSLERRGWLDLVVTLEVGDR